MFSTRHISLLGIMLLQCLILFSGCSDSQQAVLPPDIEKKTQQDNDSLNSTVGRNALEKARLILRSGENPNTQPATGLPPLHEAAANGFVEMGMLLIEHGADANLNNMINTTDQDGNKILKKGQTPLHVAATLQQLEFAKMLIRSGADVNAFDGLQRTPLDMSTSKGRTIDRLLGSTSDAQQLTNLENQSLENHAIQETLRNAGAKTSEELAQVQLEEEIKANRSKSLLGQSSERLKQSKVRSSSRKDPNIPGRIPGSSPLTPDDHPFSDRNE
ncbi:MAG TPA: ankyrin repeat domain-containing protein [Pirellulales bacterium]|nr:ankyrin repeat domain-containing protein [Pirellulales bacterium]|tara:strand:- start:218 stop:1036 length:819 start_codon:yes stop_codon:yes gene_type:complete